MTSPTDLSARHPLLISLIAVAAVVTACGSGSVVDPRAADERPETLALDDLDATDDLDAPDDAQLLVPVAEALDDLLLSSADDVDAFQRFGDAVGAALAESPDPDVVLAGVDAAMLGSYEGAETAEKAAGTDQRLGGQAIDLTVSDPKTMSDPKGGQGQGQPPGAVSDPRLKVYYVNGINNTLDFARGTNALLVQSLGHDVTHFYNPSAFNPKTYTEAWCARSIETLFAQQHQSALLAELQADADAADAIAAAAEQGTLAWLYEAVTRSLDGVARDINATVDDVALSAAERTLGLACTGVDAIKDAYQQSQEPVDFLVEWLANTYQVLEHRVAAAFDESSGFDPELVELIKTDIIQGRRVVIVGHSHGTMLARFALQEINRWYTQDRIGVCPSGATIDATTAAPVAALYVSPGFSVDVDAQQAAVMVDGDFLSYLGHSANVQATGSQVGAGPIDRHDLRRYLEPGTATLARIQEAFADLADHVSAVPDDTDACDPTPSDDDADAEPAGSGEPTWVLVDSVVNENGSDPHPHWKDVEASPGHLAWVFNDDNDPAFSAVYDVSYDVPPDRLEPGRRYEIPVSVSGLIITGESQRFTSAEVILYVHRSWDGAVVLEQNCIAQDDGLRCDEPAVNSGTLPFTAPTSGDSFEFNIDVLNCGACEVTYRYELR